MRKEVKTRKDMMMKEVGMSKGEAKVKARKQVRLK
jgi:hypothetical protein